MKNLFQARFMQTDAGRLLQCTHLLHGHVTAGVYLLLNAGLFCQKVKNYKMLKKGGLKLMRTKNRPPPPKWCLTYFRLFKTLLDFLKTLLETFLDLFETLRLFHVPRRRFRFSDFPRHVQPSLRLTLKIKHVETSFKQVSWKHLEKSQKS